MKKIISLIIVCTIIISGMFIYGKSDKKDLLEDNNGPIIAAVIDGKASTTFPTTNKYTATVECTRNGIKQDVGAKATWNGTKWVVSFNDISAGNVRCNATFITKVPTFAETILANNKVKAPITTPGATISTASEALLASTEDDYGTSYYFRGAVTNNYVEFANKCWRIVRITGDGSIKLVLHNDNTSKATNPCSATNNSTTAAFAHYNGNTYTSKFNEKNDDNAYIGFMYGTASSSDYVSTHANTNKSTILTNLETWYKNNLVSYEDKFSDTIWCNDKSTFTTYTSGSTYGTGLGYGTKQTGYGAFNRIYGGDATSYASPSLICPNDNNGGKLSKFTVDDTKNGNGNLTYKIGLLTADEIAFAGSIAYTYNRSTYLQENTGTTWWWSLSPGGFNGGGALVWGVGFGELSAYSIRHSAGLRPAISLISSTSVTGNGTSDNPYIIN